MLLHQDSPCMEYLPTYIITLSQMYVHIPYMEHLGHVISYIIIYNITDSLFSSIFYVDLL